MNVSPYAPWMEYIHLDNHRFKPNGGTYFNTCYAAYGSRFCWVVLGDFWRIRSYGMKITIELTTSWWFFCPTTSANPRNVDVDGPDEFPFQFGWIFRFHMYTPERLTAWTWKWWWREDDVPKFQGSILRFQPLIFWGVCILEVEFWGNLLTDECPFFVGRYGLQSWKAQDHQGNRIRIRTSKSQSAEIHRIQR